MIGRDWTHIGVAKLYTDIAANGYHFLYLTSRSTGQADTTRAYLNGIVQDGYRLPKGPVIMSPDRTYAALRREIYLRKPEVFKMACLRDILGLFPNKLNPFYAGYGNRLTDALSYRSVNIPQRRIFTINSNAEVSLDLLSLNKYRSSYVSMNEVVDQFFPPVSMLVGEGGEEFTDFNYWRDVPEDLDIYLPSDSDDDDGLARKISLRSEDEGSLDDDEDDDDDQGDMGDSYFSRDSIDESNLGDSMLSRNESEDGPDGSIVEDEEDDTGIFSNDDDVTPLGNGGAPKATSNAEVRSSGAKTPEIEREQPDLIEARTPKAKRPAVR
jgi:phosphatidate phosphatase LPIN